MVARVLFIWLNSCGNVLTPPYGRPASCLICRLSLMPIRRPWRLPWQ